MQFFRLLLAGLAAGLFPAVASAGDAPLEFGVTAGYVMPLHTGTFNFENITDSIPAHFFGTGSGFRFGGTLVVPLESSGGWSFGVNVGIISYTSNAFEAGTSYLYPIHDTSVYIQTFRTFRHSATSLFCDIEARYKPLANSGFGGFFGLSCSYIASTGYRQTLNAVFDPTIPVPFGGNGLIPLPEAPVIGDFNPIYADFTRYVILLYDDSTPHALKFQTYLRAGVFYDIPLGSFIISPSVSYQFPIIPVVSSQSWRVQLLGGGVEVRVGL